MEEAREFVGVVSKGPFAQGSKSSHDAVYLETKEGAWVLRRRGGNPFSDPELERLVGKTVRCRGVRSDYLLIVSDCVEVSAGKTT